MCTQPDKSSQIMIIIKKYVLLLLFYYVEVKKKRRKKDSGGQCDVDILRELTRLYRVCEYAARSVVWVLKITAIMLFDGCYTTTGKGNIIIVAITASDAQCSVPRLDRRQQRQASGT